MIEVPGVQATARELRPVQGGWGWVHWVACLPAAIPYLGMLTLTVIVMAYDSAILPPGLVSVILLATYGLWLAASWSLRQLLFRETRKSPAGTVLYDWLLDMEGIRLGSPLLESRILWGAVRTVRDERDRFVFLVSPYNNPVLPKRLLDEAQLAAVRALIAEIRASGRMGRGVD